MTDTEISFFLKTLPCSNEMLDSLSQTFDKTYNKKFVSLFNFIIIQNKKQNITKTKIRFCKKLYLHEKLQSIDINTLKSKF